jgi:hypothetical protein
VASALAGYGLLAQTLMARDEIASSEVPPKADAIKAAVAKALPLLEQGSRISMERRSRCFTCHNQGLVVMAVTAARDRGLTIDGDNLRKQLQFTADFLAKNKDGYGQGRGQGGGIDTAGYALWTLELGGWKPDATTAAVTEYLTVWQTNRDHLEPTSIRPPSQKSFFTSTHAALRGLRAFGVPEQRERIDRRIGRIRQWLVRTPAEDTEDHVFRLRGLRLAEAGREEVQRAATELLKSQRSDGGWSQRADMESDAYATGTALVALHEAGGLATTESAYSRGLRFLLSKQLEDGSWHVRTRATPVQEYFESGYPHGEDQFISIYAAGWSATALALSLPKASP